MSRRGPGTPDPRVIVAGTGSGVGKTAISCGVIRGFADMGYAVQPFKAGPDYIDPGYLAAAAGREAVNLDVWLMGRRGVMESLGRSAAGMAGVIEGVMGYYDGFDGRRDTASTHQLAVMTRTPVILCVDAGGGARSVAATVLGFLRFSRNPMIRGVILNRIGSGRHASMCRDALEPLGVRVVGAVPKQDARFDSRHLGLVPPAEDPRMAQRIAETAGRMLEGLDMEGILRIAGEAGPLPARAPPRRIPTRARLGVALDGSFNFYYGENLRRLRDAGMELAFFSPETAGGMPSVDGLYIGGGFPEVRASMLEGNAAVSGAIRRAVHDGMPAYAECGGLMYLARGLVQGGRTYRMAGVFDMDTEMAGRLTLNYTRGVTDRSPVSRRRAGFRGHEFHYSRAADIPGDAVFAQRLDVGRGISGGRDGIVSHNAMASYGHLYLSDAAARALADGCARYSRR